MNELSRRLVVLFLGLLLFVPAGLAIAPQRAQAQLLTTEVGPLETITGTIQALLGGKQLLNPLFYLASQAVLQSIVKSTVNWINSGFQGSPAFVTNLDATLQSVGDTYATGFINQLASNAAIQSPFQDILSQAVRANYFISTARDGFFLQNPYTLNQVSSNDAAFLRGDFTKGGWDAWIAAIRTPSNNPFGAQLLQEGALGSIVNNAIQNKKIELGWGNGFLGFRGSSNCSQSAVVEGNTSSSETLQGPIALGGGRSTVTGTVTGASPSVSLNNTDCSLFNGIKTPGTFIMSALDKTGLVGIDSLVNAKEFDEIVNALLSQLLNQVLSGGGGLTGVSQPNASGRSFLDQTSSSPGASAGLTVADTLRQLIDSQATQITQYQGNWQTILTAANNAKSALSTSSCVPNAQDLITTTVQPVITQATTAISNASASLAKIQTIIGEIPTINTSTAQVTAASAQANTDYQNLLASPSTPSASDVTYAQQQAQATNGTLYTQMTQLAAQARCGG